MKDAPRIYWFFCNPKIRWLITRFKVNQRLTQITIYGAACSICFANLSIYEQEEKPKKNGMKILDSQGVII